MKVITLIVQEPPSSKKAYDALRLAGASLAEDMGVNLFLLSGGIDVGRRSQPLTDDGHNLEELLGQLMEYGVTVKACGVCMDECGLVESDMLDGIERGTMKSLATWIADSDHVLSF